MTKTKIVNSSYNQMRNLVQYRNLPEEEFQEIFSQKILGNEKSKSFEDRITKKLDEFALDYDLDDLKINDRLILRQLAQAILSLEDMEIASYNMRTEGIDTGSILLFDKFQKIMSDLRADISKMQDDLKITRRIRKGDQAESVLAVIEDLKTKARKFYESRMNYIFCPKCNMLLSTIWFLYPSAKNKITLTCNRTMEDGSKCNEIVTISSKELIEKRGFNIPEVVPEGLK